MRLSARMFAGGGQFRRGCGSAEWPRLALQKIEEAQAMPLFDFRCRSCGSEFEVLVRASDLPVCPSCKSAKLEQLPSMFTVRSLEITKARVRTAKKERRRSRAYRDKIVADREGKHHDWRQALRLGAMEVTRPRLVPGESDTL